MNDETGSVMAVVRDYILRANQALRSDDKKQIDSVAEEIISAFHNEIPNIAHYRGGKIVSGSSLHTAADLKKLIGKLRVFQERKDSELYGQYGLSSLMDSIRELENALYEEQDDTQLEQLFYRVDHTYANRMPDYTQGLCGWMSSDKEPSLEQAQLRIDKLKSYRDGELREIRKAEHAKQNITQSQEVIATASSVATVTLSEACRNIDGIPGGSLSEDEKNHLKDLLIKLQQVAEKDRKGRHDKLKEVLEFLADKGADAFIAAAPFVLNLLQGL